MSHFNLFLGALLCLALAACGDEPPAREPAADAHTARLVMPAGSWAPQAPYDEARLSPFGAMR